MSSKIEICIVPFKFSNWSDDNYAYLLHDEQEDITVALDPAGSDEVLDALEQTGWNLTYIINTHHHQDHIGGNQALKEATGCHIIACDEDLDNIPDVDHAFGRDEIITLGNIELHSLFFSGHTTSDICLYSQDIGAIFTGDFLFQMGCGRVMEGSHEEMFNGLQKLIQLPSDTMVFNCHEYAHNNGKFALTLEPNNVKLQERVKLVEDNLTAGIPNQGTSLQEELDTNPFLRTNSKEIRKNLNMLDATDLEIFTEIRKRKDSFKP